MCFSPAPGIGIRAGSGDGFLNDCFFDVGLNHIFVAGSNLKINGCLHYIGNYQVTLLSSCYNVQITDCQYEYFAIAAIYANLGAANIRNVQIRGCSFVQNEQTAGSNAILIASNGAELLISDCTFRNLYGAAIGYSTDVNNRLVIENCIFDGLRARNVAPVHNQSTTMQGVQATNMHVMLRNCTFRNLPGQPITLGGGEKSTLILDNCRFENCTGGASDIAVSNFDSNSRVFIHNCTSDRALINSQATVPVIRDFMACLLTNSATQAMTGNASNILTFDTEDFDTSSFHSASSNPSRITVPPGVSYIKLGATVSVSATTSTAYDLGIRKNGSTLYGYQRIGESGAVNTSRSRTTNTPWIPVVAGDYFEVLYDDSVNSTVTVANTAFWAEGRAA